jgi:HD superfamily phosphohydrolase
MVESMNRNARAAHRTIIPVRPSDEVLLRLAALLHDIGHGFMSHVSERAMTSIVRLPGDIPASQMLKEARAYFGARPAFAEVLAGLIVRLPEFVELLSVADIPYWEDANELSRHIAQLITGSTLYHTRPFLAEIISGGIDADKLDYMPRDCYMAGLPMPVDVERILDKLQAVGVAAGGQPGAQFFASLGIAPDQTVYMLAVDLTGGKTVEEMVISRVLLYDKLYHHQKVRAFEGMIENALEVLIRESPDFSRPSTYLRLSDSEFLKGQWGIEAESESISAAKTVVQEIANRKGLIRSFAFGPALLVAPDHADDPAKLFRQQWRKMKPLVVRGSRSQPEAKEFKQAVVERARSYLRLDGQPNVADALHVIDVVIDLPDVQGIAEKTMFWAGNEETGLQLYSDLVRVERWAEAYENQKSIGYVYCRPEHAYAVHLAAREEIFARTGARFLDRELTLTKLEFQTLEAMAQRLADRGNPVQPIKRPVRWEAPPRRAEKIQVQDTYGYRLEELADRFRSFQPAEGSRIDANLITDWLVQFPRDDIKYAVTLLENIQFWTRQALADAFRSAIEQLFGANERVVQLVSLGGPTTSAEHLQYLWDDVRSTPLPLELKVVSIDDVQESFPVVFFDDYIGSGRQSSTVLQQWSGIPREQWLVDELHVAEVDRDVIERLRRCRLFFLFAAGRRQGLKLLEHYARELWEPPLVVGHVVSPRDIDCFRPAAGIFGRYEEAQQAKKAMERAGLIALADKAAAWGEKKLRDRVLGYGNSGDLTVFYYNAPSSTLTALWKQCDVPGSTWLALFRRRIRDSAVPEPPAKA